MSSISSLLEQHSSKHTDLLSTISSTLLKKSLRKAFLIPDYLSFTTLFLWYFKRRHLLELFLFTVSNPPEHHYNFQSHQWSLVAKSNDYSSVFLPLDLSLGCRISINNNSLFYLLKTNKNKGFHVFSASPITHIYQSLNPVSSFFKSYLDSYLTTTMAATWAHAFVICDWIVSRTFWLSPCFCPTLSMLLWT